MELTNDSKTVAEKMINDKEAPSSEVFADDEVDFTMPKKKSMLPKVAIGLLLVVIALVGVLLVVQQFNQGNPSAVTNSDLPAGVSPGDMVAITEDENGNMSAVDGNGNPIDLEGIEMNDGSPSSSNDVEE